MLIAPHSQYYLSHHSVAQRHGSLKPHCVLEMPAAVLYM